MTKFIILFSTGAFGYSALELLWRGKTHWTMFLLGGLLFCALYFTFSRLEHVPLFIKAVIGGGIITLAELTAGYIVNIILGWNVWSYASVPFNFLGQICLPYTLLWILLCIPLYYLCRLFREYI